MSGGRECGLWRVRMLPLCAAVERSNNRDGARVSVEQENWK